MTELDYFQHWQTDKRGDTVAQTTYNTVRNGAIPDLQESQIASVASRCAGPRYYLLPTKFQSPPSPPDRAQDQATPIPKSHVIDPLYSGGPVLSLSLKLPVASDSTQGTRSSFPLRSD